MWIAATKLSILGSPKLQANKPVCQLLIHEGFKPKELTMIERAQVRADIYARVALHYGLDAEEFTYLLTDFGTLDRSQPGSKERKRQGSEPCAITRDLCLLKFFELATQNPTAVSVPWSASERVNLREKVSQALAAGCIPYVPSQLAVQLFG